MKAIDILGLGKNKREYPQFQKAEVIKAIEGGQKRVPFKFSVVNAPKFTLTAVGLPGLETAVPTKVIRTTRIDIPFVQGDSVSIDGEIWTISDLEFVYDNKSAQVTGNAVKAWTLYLNGGKGNG